MSGPNLTPGTVCVCGINGLRKGMHTTQHPLSPASRAGTDLPTNVQAVSRAVRYVHTHGSRFQVRARPSYKCPVRLSDSTLEFPILKTTKTLSRNLLRYLSKANLPTALH